MNQGRGEGIRTPGTLAGSADFKSANAIGNPRESSEKGTHTPSVAPPEQPKRDTVSQVRAWFTLDEIRERCDVDESGCWIWRGASRGNGYGAARVDRKVLDVHRIAWMVAHGEIPAKADVCHRCDVRRCCNPKHLFLGSRRDNVRDMDEKGRRAVVLCPRHLTKLTDEQVREIRARVRGGEIPERLAGEYGVAPWTISRIASGERRRHVA